MSKLRKMALKSQNKNSKKIQKKSEKGNLIRNYIVKFGLTRKKSPILIQSAVKGAVSRAQNIFEIKKQKKKYQQLNLNIVKIDIIFCLINGYYL